MYIPKSVTIWIQKHMMGNKSMKQQGQIVIFDTELNLRSQEEMKEHMNGKDLGKEEGETQETASEQIKDAQVDQQTRYWHFMKHPSMKMTNQPGQMCRGNTHTLAGPGICKGWTNLPHS